MIYHGIWLPYPAVAIIERNLHTKRLKGVHSELLTRHELSSAARELNQEYLDWYRLNYITYYSDYFNAINAE